jgi:hypothetical protein
MTALLSLLALTRYQAALLLRSHRWLPPLLLYVILLAVGVQTGQPILDSLGFAAAALLPVSAWLVRVCVTAEPAAARACAGAAAGSARVHLASVLTALLAASLLATAACALLGTAIGVLCNWPLLRSPAWSIAVAAPAAVVLLAAGASPANAAVSSLVTGSQDGTVRWPLLPCATAALLAAAATAIACRAARRYG